jgi:16S rRNA G966 N2-methylase RsmD
MDPPYDRELEKHVMETFQNSCLADEDTLFIIEASLGTDFSWAGPMGYEIIRTKEYKTNKHVFLMKALETDKN